VHRIKAASVRQQKKAVILERERAISVMVSSAARRISLECITKIIQINRGGQIKQDLLRRPQSERAHKEMWDYGGEES